MDGTRAWARSVAAVTCTALLCGACSSGGGSKSPATSGATTPVVQTTSPPTSQEASPTEAATSGVDLSGTWAGRWTDTSPDTSVGTFTLTWTEDGSDVTGTITVRGAQCLSTGDISGSLDGDRISFGVVGGQAQVQYSGQVNGDSMAGTYSTSAACASAKGNWTASKTG